MTKLQAWFLSFVTVKLICCTGMLIDQRSVTLEAISPSLHFELSPPSSARVWGTPIEKVRRMIVKSVRIRLLYRTFLGMNNEIPDVENAPFIGGDGDWN